jgi:hypothetical protein
MSGCGSVRKHSSLFFFVNKKEFEMVNTTKEQVQSEDAWKQVAIKASIQSLLRKYPDGKVPISKKASESKTEGPNKS